MDRKTAYAFMRLIGIKKPEQQYFLFHNKEGMSELNTIERMNFLANLVKKEVKLNVEKDLEPQNQLG